MNVQRNKQITDSFCTSINAFYNALLRECGPFTLNPDTRRFVITHPESGEQLTIPCRHHATTGRHILGTALVLEAYGKARPVTFAESVDWCLDHPQLRRFSDARSRALFRQRVLSSQQNLKQTHNHLRNRLDRIFHEDADFIDSEQALINGHSIHPCPKDRGNMSGSDTLNYAPEYGGRFPLAWYSVDRTCLTTHQGTRQSVECMTASLLDSDGSCRAATAPGQVLIPCHPFQHRQWQAHPVIQRLQQGGKVRFLGFGRPDWQATSSLRAIWSENHDWMLKFSLSVRITNSIRHLQPEEAMRGPGLTRLLEREPLTRWRRANPSFRLLGEPVSLALCDDDGSPLPETTIVFRENPFRGRSARHCEVLASLLQDDPRTGLSRLALRLLARHAGKKEAHRWFRRYLDVAVAPLLEAQSEYGLLFGAHQQNLILKLDNDLMPCFAWFRDCQGTGFTSQASEKLGKSLGSLIRNSDNQPPDELGIRLFSYYLFINSTFNVISSLAASGLTGEEALLRQLRHWLEQKRSTATDPGVIDYLLHSQQLHAKNNLLCCLQALNENTLEDIASIYHPMVNPLLTDHPATNNIGQGLQNHDDQRDYQLNEDL
jgi:N2-citryl-N6-acetyl-N6-hydroxylysine synthase